MRLRSSDRVLVRLPSWLGDLVACEPVVRALSRHVRPEQGGALSLSAPGHLLSVFDGRFPSARRVGTAHAEWRGHDVALLFTGSFRSAFAAWRAGIPERVGWDRDARGPLLTLGVRPARERGGVPFGLGIAGRWPRILPRPVAAGARELVSLVGVPVAETRPCLRSTEEARLRASRRLERGPFVLVNAGGRPGSAKAAPPELLVRLVSAIHRRSGVRPVVVAGPGEEERARALAGELGPPATSLVDPVADLPELVALCEEAALVVTPDSGPRHVAAATGAPILCLTGPTDPRHSSDSFPATHVARALVPCGPCHREVCPLQGPDAHRCMLAIDDGQAVGAALALLRDPKPTRS